MGIFSPLKNNKFSLILSGQLLSDFGNWLDLIVLNSILIYSWKLGPDAVAMLLIAMGVPWILLGPILGVFADRLPYKYVLVISDLLRGCIVFSLFFVTSLWLLLLLVFLKSTVATFFEPARMRAIRSVVEPDLLSQAVSLSQISVFSTKILAPVLGGAIVVIQNPPSVFLIETVLFLVSACILMFLPKGESMSKSPEESDSKGFWTEFQDGFQHLRTTKILFLAVFLISASLFFMFLFEGLFALWTRDQHLSEQAYGMLVSGVGLGSLIGALGGGSFTAWKRKPIISMCVSTVITGVIVSFLGIGGIYQLELPIIIWVFLAFVAGVTGAFSTIPFAYVLQTETPADLIGRVSGTANALQNISTLVAPVLGAFLAKIFSTHLVFLGSGFSMFVLGLAVWVYMIFQPVQEQFATQTSPKDIEKQAL